MSKQKEEMFLLSQDHKTGGGIQKPFSKVSAVPRTQWFWKIKMGYFCVKENRMMLLGGNILVHELFHISICTIFSLAKHNLLSQTQGKDAGS